MAHPWLLASAPGVAPYERVFDGRPMGPSALCAGVDSLASVLELVQSPRDFQPPGPDMVILDLERSVQERRVEGLPNKDGPAWNADGDNIGVTGPFLGWQEPDRGITFVGGRAAFSYTRGSRLRQQSDSVLWRTRWGSSNSRQAGVGRRERKGRGVPNRVARSRLPLVHAATVRARSPGPRSNGSSNTGRVPIRDALSSERRATRGR